MTELTTLRVTVLSYDGAACLVGAESQTDGYIALTCEPRHIPFVAVSVGKEVEIECRLQRDNDGSNPRGQLLELWALENGDPRPAWREWFASVGGTEMVPREDVEPASGTSAEDDCG